MTDTERVNRKKLRDVVRKLALVQPPLYPITLEFKTSEDSWGATRIKNSKDPEASNSFIITISPEIDDVAKLFVLVHEYAHAVQWRAQHQENLRAKDHDAEWGIHYATVWELVLGFLEPEDG